MGRLERPSHGWEGISNGGEIYGSQPKIVEEVTKEDIKLDLLKRRINDGADIIASCQVIYNLSYEEVIERITSYYYNRSIAAGNSPERAKQIACVMLKNIENNRKFKR